MFLFHIGGGCICFFTVAIMYTNTYKIQNEFDKLVWNTTESSIYNALCQFTYFTGIAFLIFPCVARGKSLLRRVMSSHLWNFLEELTNSAYLISSLI